jgi:pimeloyl-ACP methyl ester carboxylesterase
MLSAPAPGHAQPVPANGELSGFVEVGARRVFLECRGSGSPVVVLISGYRNTAEIWTVQGEPGQTMVMPALAGLTRVCAYDRPGTILDATHRSKSDRVAMPRTADAIVGELHRLLKAAGIPPPYVLVAHSLGGLFARLYASTYPDEVAGLVLVDAWSEAFPGLLGPDQWPAYQDLAQTAPPGLEDYSDLEMVDFGAASDRMRRAAVATPLRDLPLYVLSRGRLVALPPDVPASFSPAAFEQAWRQGQDVSPRCCRTPATRLRAKATITSRSSSPVWSSAPHATWSKRFAIPPPGATPPPRNDGATDETISFPPCNGPCRMRNPVHRHRDRCAGPRAGDGAAGEVRRPCARAAGAKADRRERGAGPRGRRGVRG